MVAVTIFLIISLLLVFAGMIFNALSSSSCQQTNPPKAYTYYVGAMISLSLSAISMIIALVIYWGTK